MRVLYGLLALTFFCSTLVAQVNVEKVFEKKYTELPFTLRIENSGIYSISSFDIEGNTIAFKTYDNALVYLYDKQSQSFTTENAAPSFDVVLSNQKVLQKNFSLVVENDFPTISKKVFAENNTEIVSDNNGKLISNGKVIALVKVSPDLLELNSVYLIADSKLIYFPKSLAYASIIGIDKSGNHFLLIEEFESQYPLKVTRSILTISQSGDVLSRLTVPMVKYLSLLKEFQIDDEGNVYHLFSLQNEVLILKIGGLTEHSESVITYPSEYQKDVHFNYFVSTDEYKGDTLQQIELSASRLAAVKLGDSYVLHKYRTTASNLAPTNITDPNGDIVRTPAWLVVGMNAKVPYKWGGFQTIAQFNDGLAAGKYAGDIHTSGVSSHAVGVDCSGFVSRCWQLSYQSSTSMMPDITTVYGDWNLLKPGDAIHKIGHVRMFLERNANGSFRIVESSARDWGVSYWSYTASDLTTYTARYYNGMAANYSFNRPILEKAEIAFSNQINLTWKADTTGISSFKVYGSSNGKDWQLISTVSGAAQNVVVNPNTNINSFRISSIANDASQTESNWSNALSVVNKNSANKTLIVDGFERDNGSWQGPGHTFVSRYALALNEFADSYESVKNSAVINGSVLLQNYNAVYWILGDESTIHETFNSVEQTMVKAYLENGGKLFVSGSEIGWDLSSRGDAADKLFYANYLKAAYVSDGAGVLNASGVAGTVFQGLSVRFGQTYEEDSPDEINPANGSISCFSYSNNKGAGVCFSGGFGASSITAKLFYFAFPVETIADDSVFNSLISKSFHFFEGTSSVEDNQLNPTKFVVNQNYPNPFNPTTLISWQSAVGGWQTLTIYDMLGREVANLLDEYKPAGNHSVLFNSETLTSGVYFYRVQSGNFSKTMKMIVLQ